MEQDTKGVAGLAGESRGREREEVDLSRLVNDLEGACSAGGKRGRGGAEGFQVVLKGSGRFREGLLERDMSNACKGSPSASCSIARAVSALGELESSLSRFGGALLGRAALTEADEDASMLGPAKAAKGEACPRSNMEPRLPVESARRTCKSGGSMSSSSMASFCCGGSAA